MRKLFMTLSFLVTVSLLLAACAPQAPTATEPAVGPTVAEPTATEAPTAIPLTPTAAPTTRHGGWLDEIDFSQVDGDSAISQIQAGAIDFYSYGVASDKFKDIQDSGLCYTQAPAVYYGTESNPATFTDTNTLNPFADHKIREALNWLVDSNYINQEIYAGGSLTKILPMISQMPEYTAIVDTVRGLEAYYAYNPDKAKEVITTEMTSLGAELGSDGKWQFKGKPVNVEYLIRNDGDGTRLPTGDYVSDQLESVGFTVTRHYGNRADLRDIWGGTDPRDGKWNIYTAAFVNTALPIDEAVNFQAFYLPEGSGGALEQQLNVPDPEFSKVGNDLANGNFTTLEERDAMMRKAATLAVQDSLYAWNIDGQNYGPYNCNLGVTYDIGSGPETAQMMPYGLRFKDKEGGAVKIGTSTLFTGSYGYMDSGNFVSDGMVQNTTVGDSFMSDPYTGLYWPLRAESAAVTVQTGLPIQKTLDWVTLDTADSIAVPADAWADWDAKAQTFIPAGEGKTAKVKVCVNYPADMFDTVKWHDGSNLSVADFVMHMIMVFDWSKPESAIYDESQVTVIENFLSHFKGVQIVSTDPLQICTYEDRTYKDAEWIANFDGSWWPGTFTFSSAEAPWQTSAIGNMTDAAGGEASWGQTKATDKKTEWINLIGGPSLEMMAKHLDEAIANKTIPFEPTLGQYITADEAVARYQALKDFYTARGHMWEGTGPYYIDSVDLNAGSVVVKNFADYADLADRWAKFSAPPLAEGTLDGPAQVKIGDESVFTLTLTTKEGDPYPSTDVKYVKFLLYNEKGETVYVGEGAPGDSDGVFNLTIPGDVSAKLTSGTGRIEAAAVLIPVAIPAFATLDYVVTP